MEQTILTAGQRTILDCFTKRKDLAEVFYLSGGTALAEFYLHHRYSEDLDFFISTEPFPQFAVEAFIAVLKDALGVDTVVYRRLHERRIFFFRQKNDEDLKVEFTLYPFQQLEPPSVRPSGFLIDSLQDIAANKVMALMDRIEPKDFVDLYFLLRENDMTTTRLRELVEKKFKLTLEPITLGSAFAKIRNVSVLPRMIKPLTVEELKSFFMERVKELGPEILTQ